MPLRVTPGALNTVPAVHKHVPGVRQAPTNLVHASWRVHTQLGNVPFFHVQPLVEPIPTSPHSQHTYPGMNYTQAIYNWSDTDLLQFKVGRRLRICTGLGAAWLHPCVLCCALYTM